MNRNTEITTLISMRDE